MATTRIVEPVYVFEDGHLSLPAGVPCVPPDQLGLDGFEERFNGGIEAPIFVNTAFPVFLACKDV